MTRSPETVAYDHQIFAYQRFGGVSRYITELASRIPAVSSISTHIVAPLHINESLKACPARKIAAYAEWRFSGGRALRGAVNRLTSRAVMEILRPSVVHWTYFNPIPLPKGSRSVVTVYDMVHELFAGDFASNDPTTTNKRRSVEHADHVICISENTKSDLMRLMGVHPEKISVTYLGFSDAFRRAPAVSGAATSATRPYLLYVGQRSGYKGFADAVRAYAASERLMREVDLVAFGGAEFHTAEHALFRALGLRDGAVKRMTGSDADLANAYRGARAFVYPSKYEGFGIPPLEAMACGCPVICSNTSSLPEVVGDAAIQFDPAVLEAACAAMESACFDEQRRGALVQAGMARAAQFSWDRCAQETAAIYSRVLDR